MKIIFSKKIIFKEYISSSKIIFFKKIFFTYFTIFSFLQKHKYYVFKEVTMIINVLKKIFYILIFFINQQPIGLLVNDEQCKIEVFTSILIKAIFRSVINNRRNSGLLTQGLAEEISRSSVRTDNVTRQRAWPHAKSKNSF